MLSHVLGTVPVGLALVLGGALAARARGETDVVRAWLLVGATTLASFSLIKQIVGRARPALWPRLVQEGGSSFPSGHAMATAAFFPLLAFLLARRAPRWAPVFWAFGLGLPLYVGFGRLYLGVHWPTDVLAGWAMGALQSGLAIAWLRGGGRSSVAPSGPSA